jgi:hypothetical protein
MCGDTLHKGDNDDDDDDDDDDNNNKNNNNLFVCLLGHVAEYCLSAHTALSSFHVYFFNFECDTANEMLILN